MAKRPTDEERIEEQKESYSVYVKESMEEMTKYIEKAMKKTDEEIRQEVLANLEDSKKEFQEWNEELIARGDEPVSNFADFAYSYSDKFIFEQEEDHDYGKIVLTDETVEDVVALLIARRDRLRAMPEEEKTRKLEAYRQRLIKNYAESMADDTDVIHTAYYRHMDEEEKAQAKTLKEKLIHFFGLQDVSLPKAALGYTGVYSMPFAAIGLLATGALFTSEIPLNEFVEVISALAATGAIAFIPVTGGLISIITIATAIVRRLIHVKQDRDIKKGLEKIRELSEKSPEWKLIYDEVVNKLQEMNIDADVAVERGL